MGQKEFIIRQAVMQDVENIHKIIIPLAEAGEMLPRSQLEILENLRDFIVAEDKTGHLIGCGALHFSWYDLAEIKSLAVKKEWQRKQIGKQIVNLLIEQVKNFNIPAVFALTYKPKFFKKLGFYEIDKNKLPKKIWFECVKCPKFPDCNEIAVWYDIKK